MLRSQSHLAGSQSPPSPSTWEGSCCPDWGVCVSVHVASARGGGCTAGAPGLASCCYCTFSAGACPLPPPEEPPCLGRGTGSPGSSSKQQRELGSWDLNSPGDPVAVGGQPVQRARWAPGWGQQCSFRNWSDGGTRNRVGCSHGGDPWIKLFAPHLQPC